VLQTDSSPNNSKRMKQKIYVAKIFKIVQALRLRHFVCKRLGYQMQRRENKVLRIERHEIASQRVVVQFCE
jgi:hypothetical protein